MDMKLMTLLLFLALPIASATTSTVHYYVVYPNGTLNSSYSNISSYTGLVNNTNAATNGMEGWAIALVPFVIVLGGLSYKMNPTAALSLAGMVGMGISLLETQILTLAASANLQLYVFIAIMMIGAFAYLLTGVQRPYD